VSQALQAMALMQARGATRIEVRKDVQDAYNRRVQAGLAGSVWNTGCASWYLNAAGKNTAIWPGSAASYARATRQLSESAVMLGTCARAKHAKESTA
jgi:hypothetical protein